MGEPVSGHGSCLPNLAPTGFSKWELGYISHTWNSTRYWGALPDHFRQRRGIAHVSMCYSQFLCTALRTKEREAVQDPCVVLHWVIMAKRLEPSKACIPVWDPAYGSWLLHVWALSPRWALCLLPSPMWDKSKSPRSQEAKRARDPCLLFPLF